MTSLLGVAVCVLFCSILVKDESRTFALLLSISGICLILYSVSGEVKTIVDGIKSISNLYFENVEYIKLMLKVLAITLLTQIVSDICRDNGENALAGVTEFSTKIVLITMVLPLFETIIKIVGGFLK